MTELSISRRGVEIPASATRMLAPLADEAKARGVRVIRLNIGQPDIETPSQFWEAVCDFPERTLAYGPSAGYSECIEGMLNYYARFDILLTPEQIIVTTAGSESLLVAFGDDYVPSALMAEAAHGTAPALEGKDVANPMAMILAGAALLSLADEERIQTAGRAIREACLEAVADGIRTDDLGGHESTRGFTDEVIRRTRTKLEVWSSL